MDSDFVRKQININKRVGELERIELYQAAVSKFLTIPGLVGFWPMSSVQRSTGNVYDLSGQGRTLTAASSGVSYNIYNDIVPYADMDGASGVFSRADETDFDITGTETINSTSVRGMTIGGWFWTDAIGSVAGLMTKDNVTTQRSYLLYLGSTGVPSFAISNSGSGTAIRTDGAVISSNSWNFLVGKFIPSTSLNVYINNVLSVNTTSIPASIFVGTAIFSIGSISNTSLLNGRASFCFLSHQSLPDDFIGGLFSYSRVLFGV